MEERRWEMMDTNCLANIFERLGLDDLTLGVPFVCRPWLEASMYPICWKSLDFRALDFMPWSKFVNMFMLRYGVQRFSFTGFMRLAVGRSCGMVVEIRFPRHYAATSKDFVYASTECPKLQSLVFSNIILEDEAQIPSLLHKWKHLERVEMESKPSCFIEMAKQISINCNKFSTLKMTGSLRKEDASAIVNYLPRLKALELSKSFLAKDQLLVIMTECKELERLIVRECFGFAVDGDVMKRAETIRKFESEGCRMSYANTEDDEFYIDVIC